MANEIPPDHDITNCSHTDIGLCRKCSAEVRAGMLVADTLLARRDIDAEIIRARVGRVPEGSTYWTSLMRRERDARIANDRAVVAYREVATDRTPSGLQTAETSGTQTGADVS